jgi:hypothetical protein
LGKQRCLKCDLIRDTEYFSLHRTYCDSCISTDRICSMCGSVFPDITTSNKNSICKKCSNKQNRMIKEIINLVGDLNIETIPGFEEIDLTQITLFQLQEFHEEELSLLLEILNSLYDDYYIQELEEEEDIQEVEEEVPELINPLDFIKKYKILLDKKLQKNIPNEQWRLNIPKSLKLNIKTWRTDSIRSIYDQSKILLENFSGKDKEEIKDFICDLSEIIFEKPPIEKISLNDIDQVEDWVISHLEMIVLPQLDVLERLEKNNGKLNLDGNWTKELSNTLIKEVHERDGWHCFICNNDYNLRLHNIISIEPEKNYHKDNLVTLCVSCKDAVDTRSVKKSFTQCLKNFIENY